MPSCINTNNLNNNQDKKIYFPKENNNYNTLPNIFIRSELFTVAKRKIIHNQDLVSRNNFNINFTGVKLDQVDFDLFMAIKHLCSFTYIGDEVKFPLADIIRHLNIKNSTANRKLILQRALRLRNANFLTKVENHNIRLIIFKSFNFNKINIFRPVT